MALGARRRLAAPGVWVITEDRRLWFVTNGKRIRPFYPNATSRIIMTANPSIAPMVDMCVSCPCCDSGINSSTTT